MDSPGAVTVGLVGAGHMGAGLGWALRAGGHPVITCLAGRSARTAQLAAQAGVDSRADLGRAWWWENGTI